MSSNRQGSILFPQGVEWEQRAEKAARPDEWSDFWYSGGAADSKTGIEVNEDVALTLAAAWACIKVISEDLSSLPLVLYRGTQDQRDRARNENLYFLLHDQPNPEMTSMQFREAMQGHLLSWGNCFAQITRDYRARPIGLWPLHPGRMEVKRYGKSGDLYYHYTLEDGSKTDLPFDEVLHVAGLGFNGLVGYSVIRYHADTIGIGLSAQEFQATSYKNGARLQLAFVHPAPKAPEPDKREKFAERLRKEYGGRKGNSIGVLWEGMKPEKIGMTMEDAQIIERLKLGNLDMCRIFRVPPHKIMDLERATFSNIENQDIDYAKSTIRPWAVRWEQAIKLKLIGRANFFAEHLIDALLRGDLKSRYDAYAVGIQWGFLTINKICELENMNGIGPDGNKRLRPLNMAYIGEPDPAPKLLPAAPPAADPTKRSDDPVTDEERDRAVHMIRKLRLIGG
jgi:HK97 family phage portal protein